jgi:hypothetical protein
MTGPYITDRLACNRSMSVLPPQATISDITSQTSQRPVDVNSILADVNADRTEPLRSSSDSTKSLRPGKAKSRIPQQQSTWKTNQPNPSAPPKPFTCHGLSIRTHNFQRQFCTSQTYRGLQILPSTSPAPITHSDGEFCFSVNHFGPKYYTIICYRSFLNC